MLYVELGHASADDLARAKQLLQEAKYQEAYELLSPLAPQYQDNAAFNAALGESALRTQRTDEAITFFQRSLDVNPDSKLAHLGLGRAFLAQGNYTRAKIEFETVLRFDDLPTDLHQQVLIYAQAAEDYAAGDRLLPFAYIMAGYGNYRINSTRGTREWDINDVDDDFLLARTGGGLYYQLNDDYSLNGSLDYRHREYDNNDRRDDRDLRWNGAVNRTLGENNVAVGVRGRSSYRGDGDYRNDYGIYTDWRYAHTEDNQFNFGAEFRRRQYPNGPERSRSRDIAELTAKWTHSLFDGKHSVSLSAAGGGEFETDDRPYGDATFFSLSPALNFTITDTLGGFIFAWWQHDNYNDRAPNVNADGIVVSNHKREDDLYEVGGGLTWEFAQKWSLNPEILYIRDDSNMLAWDYASTEIWFTIRRDF